MRTVSLYFMEDISSEFKTSTLEIRGIYSSIRAVKLVDIHTTIYDAYNIVMLWKNQIFSWLKPSFKLFLDYRKFIFFIININLLAVMLLL